MSHSLDPASFALASARMMALFFSIALPAGVLLAAVALFVFVDSAVARGIAVVIAAVPVLFIGAGRLRDAVIDHRIEQDRIGAGYFESTAMQTMGRAVVARDLDVLKRVGPTVDVNTAGEGGMTLLALAAERLFVGEMPASSEGGAIEIVRTLLALGGRPDQGLVAATGLKQPTLLRLLLDAGANPNLRVDGGQPLVFQRLSILHPEQLRLLAAHGLDLNTTAYGDPLPVSAAIYRRWDLLIVLIELGADTARPRPDGRTVAGELEHQIAEEVSAGRPLPPDLVSASMLLDSKKRTKT